MTVALPLSSKAPLDGPADLLGAPIMRCRHCVHFAEHALYTQPGESGARACQNLDVKGSDRPCHNFSMSTTGWWNFLGPKTRKAFSKAAQVAAEEVGKSVKARTDIMMGLIGWTTANRNAARNGLPPIGHKVAVDTDALNGEDGELIWCGRIRSHGTFATILRDDGVRVTVPVESVLLAGGGKPKVEEDEDGTDDIPSGNNKKVTSKGSGNKKTATTGRKRGRPTKAEAAAREEAAKAKVEKATGRSKSAKKAKASESSKTKASSKVKAKTNKTKTKAGKAKTKAGKAKTKAKK